MLPIAFCMLLCVVTSAVSQPQLQNVLSGDHGWPKVPGNSIARLCPGSHENDIFAIDRITNDPDSPYLNEGIMVLIYGNFTRDVSRDSNVDWQVVHVDNAGGVEEKKGAFHICDYVEELRQPPDSKTVNSCPPRKGPAMLNYVMWFAGFLGWTPGRMLIKVDAKTPEGEQIYCLITEFDLQCLPDHRGPECQRNAVPEKSAFVWLLRGVRKMVRR